MFKLSATGTISAITLSFCCIDSREGPRRKFCLQPQLKIYEGGRTLLKNIWNKC